MSQKSEKYARRLNRPLEQRVNDLAQMQGRVMQLERDVSYLEWIRDQSDKMADQMKRTVQAAERREAACRRNMYLSLLLAGLVCTTCLVVTAKADETQGEDTESSTVQVIPQEAPQEDYENAKIEAALLEKAHVLENCTVTHYDVCVRCCGKTDGITASGLLTVPGVTVAVDPAVIPLGSDVLVDYGDGVLHYYRADDTGFGVQGGAIDVCVGSHEEAVELGQRTATVYWVEPALES